MPTLPRVFLAHPLPPQALSLVEGKVDLCVGPEVPSLPADLFAREVRAADALVTLLSDPVGTDLLEEGKRLKIVANYASGYNNVDVKAAESLGIWVTNTPDATTDATADAAFGLLLAVARHITESERFLREGRFDGWSPTRFLGMHLAGATLGIVGMGRIGKAVARRARGFDMKVVYSSRRRLPKEEEQALGVSHLPLEELLAKADAVSLHCPLTPETRHLIDAAALARMKPTALLINTSRGPVVDEAALAKALHSGKLGGVGLDVYEEEPKVNPMLLTAPRAVLVPHIGTSTLQTRLAMAEKAFGDVLRVLEGKEPGHPVNRPKNPRK